MKPLYEYLNQPILTESQPDHPDTQSLADGKFGEKDLVDIFKKAGLKADVEWMNDMWTQVNMNEKYAPARWGSVLNGQVYAKRDVSVTVSPKDLDKLFKLLDDKWKTDVEQATKAYQGHAYLTLSWSYPDWNDCRGGVEDMSLYDANGVLIFLRRIAYNERGGAIDPNDCREAGDGDILIGARKLAKEIEIGFNIWVDISELAADNFVYPISNPGGSNDCLGKPIQVGNLVVYQTSTGLEVGKIQEIKGKTIEILMNNQFGKTISFNNGKKMCVIDDMTK